MANNNDLKINKQKGFENIKLKDFLENNNFQENNELQLYVSLFLN
jgi:hypothetical protein